MILENKEIADFGKFLYELKATGKQSRMRTRLVKLLEEHLTIIRQEMNDIYAKYSEKNADGTPKTETDETGNSFYTIEDTEKCNTELIELLSEEFVLENTLERKDMLLAVKELVLEIDLEFSGEEAELYDRYCEILEGIQY